MKSTSIGKVTDHVFVPTASLGMPHLVCANVMGKHRKSTITIGLLVSALIYV